MAAILPSGMRAISTPIREETAAGGFILPNDRVDVILSHKMRVGTKEEPVSEAVLRNVRVLAIGQEIENKDGEKVATGKTATLELTPRKRRFWLWRSRWARSHSPCAASLTPLPGNLRP